MHRRGNLGARRSCPSRPAGVTDGPHRPAGADRRPCRHRADRLGERRRERTQGWGL